MEGEADKLYSVLEPVAKCIDKYEDFAAFHSVSTSWRAASSAEVFQGLRLVQRTPHLMLSAKEEDDDREFYSLMEEGVVARVSLPKIRGKRCLESLGWFLTVSEQGEMSLINPFTSHEERLPYHEDFPHFARVHAEPNSFIKKMVLSSRPCQNSNFVVMVIYDSYGCLGFWRPGDENWKLIEITLPVEEESWRRRSHMVIRTFHDLAYFNGQFFTIDSTGIVWVCNLANPNLNTAKFFTDIPCYKDRTQFYIVESSGKLIVVACHRRGENWDEWSRRGFLKQFNISRLWDKIPPFEIFEVDIDSRTCARINSLGGKGLFIGLNSSLLMNASDALKIKANHIYYAGSLCLPNAAAWIYNLEDGNLELLDKGSLLGCNCTPVWISPCF